MAAARGGSGCKNWCSLPYDNRSGACGWRPILEPIMLVLNDASIGQDIEVRKLGSNIVVCGKLLHFTDYDLIIEVDGFVWPRLDWPRRSTRYLAWIEPISICHISKRRGEPRWL